MKDLRKLKNKKLKKLFKKAERSEAHKKIDEFYNWIEKQNKKKNPHELEAPRKMD